MNRRYSVDSSVDSSVEWEDRDLRVNGQRVRSPLGRFLVAACTVALGIAVVWLALFVVLPVLGVTVSILFGVLLAVIGGAIALLFAVPWVIALLAAVGVLKWLFGR